MSSRELAVKIHAHYMRHFLGKEYSEKSDGNSVHLEVIEAMLLGKDSPKDGPKKPDELRLPNGRTQWFMKCRRCGQKATYDFIPYSLSSAIRIPPCSHDFRYDYIRIHSEEFNAD